MQDNLPLLCNGNDCDKILHCNSVTPCTGSLINITETITIVTLKTYGVGHVTLYLNTSSVTKTSDGLKSNKLNYPFVQLSIGKSRIITWISFTVGWIYFAAWSLSFYPQVIENWQRKSVTGLNFDFIFLNLMGFICYSIFNICLYYVDSFKEQYYIRYPLSSIPVELNDVFFAIHAVILTLITIIQICIYERGGQKVAIWSISFMTSAIISSIILGILVMTNSFNKLDYIYFFSYVKLIITIIKYIPQAYFNYRRKSTVGWSIGNILLDFTGGTLSILQMILISYDYDDWRNIFGNPTKFGLGMFSILFDILFILQHYLFYRSSSGSHSVLRSEEHN